MQIDTKQIASDFIIYARCELNNWPDGVFAKGWILNDLVEDDPVIAWKIIKILIETYPEADYYSATKTEAQRVIGLLAAGPIEDILSIHGPIFIEDAELEAGRDRRMAWALGGAWQFTMSDDIWARVQRAADYSWWERPKPE